MCNQNENLLKHRIPDFDCRMRKYKELGITGLQTPGLVFPLHPGSRASFSTPSFDTTHVTFTFSVRPMKETLDESWPGKYWPFAADSDSRTPRG